MYNIVIIYYVYLYEYNIIMGTDNFNKFYCTDDIIALSHILLNGTSVGLKIGKKTKPNNTHTLERVVMYVVCYVCYVWVLLNTEYVKY